MLNWQSFTMVMAALTQTAILFSTDVDKRTIDPLVSTEWLVSNQNNQNLVMMDIRTPEEYAQGHIANTINQPFTAWAVNRDGLNLELPELTDLLKMLGATGINPASRVVIINKNTDDFNRADAARVAWTLAYAGVKNMAILDGGITKWISEKKTVTTATQLPTALTYTGKINANVFVSKAYVEKILGNPSTSLIDARYAQDYFGLLPLKFASRPGHILHANCLPGPWLFNENGTYKPTENISAMVSGVLGKDPKNTELIAYCGVGRFGSTLWFALSQMLGYPDVKLFDGSTQEWSNDPQAPMSLYQWK